MGTTEKSAKKKPSGKDSTSVSTSATKAKKAVVASNAVATKDAIVIGGARKVFDQGLHTDEISVGRSSHCSNCSGESRSRRRTFSEQAWTVLLLWNEINPAAVDQPICEDCYQEMREILIDRNDEIDLAMQQRDEVAKVKRHLNNIAS